MPELTVDEDLRLTEVAADPAKITDREEAMKWIVYLETEIANISAQLDTAARMAGYRLPSEEQQAWYRKAAFARRYKEADRDRLVRRERELRTGVADTAEMAEAEAKLEDIRLRQRRLEVDEERQWRRRFVDIVGRNMDAGKFWAWVKEAKAASRVE
jgi:hypothetical protein